MTLNPQLERSQPVQIVDTGLTHDDPAAPKHRVVSLGRRLPRHAVSPRSLWRLNELAYLPTLARISSVSGRVATHESRGLPTPTSAKRVPHDRTPLCVVLEFD
jgi:hypothetical protein